MALFKPLRGTSADLANISPKDGYAYFCTDDGSFWIAFENASGTVERKRINANEVNKLNSHTHGATVPAHNTADATITPEGTVSVNQFTPKGSVTSAFTGASMTATGTFTPRGNISAPKFTGTKATISMNYTPAGSVTYTPKGAVGSHTHSVSSVTGAVKSMATAGTLPSLTFSKGTLPTATLTANKPTQVTFKAGSRPAWSASYNAETEDLAIGWSAGTADSCSVTAGTAAALNFSAGTLPSATFSAGSMPTFTDITVIKSVEANTGAKAPSWVGTEETVDLAGTAATLSTTYTPDGTVAAPAFTGTKDSVSVTGTTAGSVASTFAGTAGNISATFKGKAASHKHSIDAVNMTTEAPKA